METTFLKNRDIILFALKSWDSEIGTSSVKYAEIFARNGNRVLFVNRALDRASVWIHRNDPKTKNRRETLKNPAEKLKHIQDNIWLLNPGVILESINKLPKGALFNFFNKINNRRLAREINEAMTKLGFKNPILYVENDFVRGFYQKELLKGIDKTVYYIRDYLRSQHYFKKHGGYVEPAMIAKADVVTCNSEYLAEYARKYNTNAHFVGQGVDHRIFRDEDYPLPADMKGIPGPVIGYVGAIITTRLDIDIIRQIALARKNWSIVLVGPEDEDFARCDLHGMSNVYFLGPKKLDELPAYIRHFDVCINPQAVNDMTIGNYPLKADEYLTQGKPMVATRTLGMKMFEDYVYLCDSTAEYITNIEAALNEDNKAVRAAARKAFAASHTWENCVLKLDKALIDLQKN